jgi:hypothetical protein
MPDRRRLPTGAQDTILPHNCSTPPPRGAQAVYGLLAFETVYAVLVSFRDVGQRVDELAQVGEAGSGLLESCGGLFFQVAVQAAEEFE